MRERFSGTKLRSSSEYSGEKLFPGECYYQSEICQNEIFYDALRGTNVKGPLKKTRGFGFQHQSNDEAPDWTDKCPPRTFYYNTTLYMDIQSHTYIQTSN